MIFLSHIGPGELLNVNKNSVFTSTNLLLLM